MRGIHLVLAAILALPFTSAACQAQAPAGEQKSIVVTYSVLGSVVSDLVGDKASVSVLTPNGLDPHEWEPSARDIESINKAWLVVENGLGLESGMGKALDRARNSGVRFFTASDHFPVRQVRPGEGIPSGDPDQAIGAPDPHFWTDPVAMEAVVSALADSLATDFGLGISGRAADLLDRLKTLDAGITAIVSEIPAADRKLVTGHESMGYFAQRYGFKLVGVIVPSLSSQAGVSAADLAALKAAIRDNQVGAVFAELGTSPVVANAIASETGVRVVQLTTHALPADGSYFTFMKNLATVVSSALK